MYDIGSNVVIRYAELFRFRGIYFYPRPFSGGCVSSQPVLGAPPLDRPWIQLWAWPQDP